MDFRDIFDETEGERPANHTQAWYMTVWKAKEHEEFLWLWFFPLDLGRKEKEEPGYRKGSKIVWSCPGQYGSH